jgi:hypothetical protein
MSEETQAASSPAEDVDVFNGEQPTMAEFDSYRKTGELPMRFKPAETAESATADAQEETEEAEETEETPEDAPDSAPDEDKQELKPKTARRIQQLLDKNKELERQLEAATKPTQAESSPAAAAQPEHTRPKPSAEDKDKDGKPKYETYEDFVEDLADWKAEQRHQTWQREQAEQKAQEALKVKLDESRARYEDADEVIFPAAAAVSEAKIPLVVKEVFAGSDLFTDLCYVVGSDPKELDKFLTLAQRNPREAIAKVFEYERGIREELAKDKGEAEGNKAPEVKKTSAPKPPSPVNGTSSRAFDVNDETLSPEEWARKRTAQLTRKG